MQSDLEWTCEYFPPLHITLPALVMSHCFKEVMTADRGARSGTESPGSPGERRLGERRGDGVSCVYSIPDTNAAPELPVNPVWSEDSILLIQNSSH